MGGKHRLGKRIANVLLAARGAHTSYLEPFVGAGGVLRHVAPHFDMVVASDLHKDLILLWQALQSGWVPPDALSFDEYQELRQADPSALRAFAGYGLSYGGKWFGGYAREYRPSDDYCGAARRGLLHKIASAAHVDFRHCDYREWHPNEKVLIYCDPPYRGTTRSSATRESFDTSAFWACMRKWASHGATVFVSEYGAPDEPGIELAHSADLRTCLNENDGWLTERLYRVWP